LTYSYTIPWNLSAHEIIQTYAHSTARHLVFNCHGFASRPDFPAPHLSLGTVFHAGNVSAFDPISQYPTTQVIWLSACNLAESSEGAEFCKEIARRSRCYVVTAVTAIGDVACAANAIEDWYRSMPVYYSPKGELVARTAFLSQANSLGFK